MPILKQMIFLAAALVSGGLCRAEAPAKSGSTGILLREDGTTFRVRHLLVGSPARNSGEVDLGDAIVAVAEPGRERQSLEGKTMPEVLDLLAGPPGSEVVVFARGASGETRAVRLTRADLLATTPGAALQLLDEGATAPAFQCTDLSTGKALAFPAEGEGRVMLVFWASWDPRSRAAMASLRQTAAEWPEAMQRRVLAVSLDHDESDAIEYVASRKWGAMRQAWTDSEASEHYRIRKLPQAFLVDEQGVIRKIGEPMTLDAPAFFTPPPTPAP